MNMCRICAFLEAKAFTIHVASWLLERMIKPMMKPTVGAEARI